MKSIALLPLILFFMLLGGAGCPPPASPAGEETKPAPTPQTESESATVTEPFDTNDYLNEALEELDAVE